MEPKYNYTAAGKFLYKLCAKGAKFLYKHPVIYWILICTGGIIGTAIGGLIGLVCLPFCKRCGRFGRTLYQIIGNDWGGLSTGCCCLIGDTYSDGELHTKQHEMGHMYQLALLGPFHIFLVEIPSAIRYGYLRMKKDNNTPYDAIWFEGSATDIGQELYK